MSNDKGNNIGQLFPLIHGARSDVHLSGHGIIVQYDDGATTAQPPRPINFESCPLRKLNMETVESSLTLSRKISNFERSKREFYLDLFKHLHELRCAKRFVGQLGAERLLVCKFVQAG